jgi:hypothetical protein
MTEITFARAKMLNLVLCSVVIAACRTPREDAKPKDAGAPAAPRQITTVAAPSSPQRIDLSVATRVM